MTVGELRKIIEGMPDDCKVHVSIDEGEGNYEFEDDYEIEIINIDAVGSSAKGDTPVVLDIIVGLNIIED